MDDILKMRDELFKKNGQWYLEAYYRQLTSKIMKKA
tara:strand:+ start:539 stop:646 length:108 start_codon:yes stop_codon:yes gene_type:complete